MHLKMRKLSAPSQHSCSKRAELCGLQAIQAWVEESTRKYQAQFVSLALQESGDHAVLRGQVSGNFPGSPIELDFDFVLSEGKITRLAIK